MSALSKDLEHKLTRAKVGLLLDHPFFGTLSTKLLHTADNGIPTAATNGVLIKWNPDFLAKLPAPQVLGVLAHEILHVAAGHTWRRDSRDPKAWNIAADLAINHILKEAGLQLPDGVLWPDASQAGRAAESLYVTPSPSDEDGDKSGKGGGGEESGEGSDPGGSGGVEDAPGGDEGGKAQEAEWKVAVAQATVSAKSQGSLPAALDRFIKEILNPTIPWQTELRDFVSRTAQDDYSWARPNRRYVNRGFILPTLQSDRLDDIVVAVDTSGSIGQEQIDKFAAELSGILQAYQTTIHVIYVDAAVHGHDVFTREDLPLKLNPVGGGGTDFAPAFEWVADNDVTPAALIYLTDLAGSFPDVAPDYPVLWAVLGSWGDAKAPFGKTIPITD